jgi:hypothetical protein
VRDRRFADVVAGALACISVLGGCYAMLREAEHYARRRHRLAAARWALPGTRRLRHSPEDDCRHCTGAGSCPQCSPDGCRVCRGTGLQPHDDAVASRLGALWDGAA